MELLEEYIRCPWLWHQRLILRCPIILCTNQKEKHYRLNNDMMCSCHTEFYPIEPEQVLLDVFNTGFYHILLLCIYIDKGYLKYTGECVFLKVFVFRVWLLGLLLNSEVMFMFFHTVLLMQYILERIYNRTKLFWYGISSNQEELEHLLSLQPFGS